MTGKQTKGQGTKAMNIATDNLSNSGQFVKCASSGYNEYKKTEEANAMLEKKKRDVKKSEDEGLNEVVTANVEKLYEEGIKDLE
ncbi:hypothetical protein INT45_005914 [Circinella minor]|uniref:Uncharacterized protein n=1 Tax=Circinella minor TaxID=1195481 RepID=A0A8H7RDD2_9FUNG|nr:hypothetical protein INT45_005914 [Circinella minor]